MNSLRLVAAAIGCWSGTGPPRGAVLGGALAALLALAAGCGRPAGDDAARLAAGTPASRGQPIVELTAGQLSTLTVSPVGTHSFPLDDEAIGNIDFDGDLAVQVFPAYQGKILAILVALGDPVAKGQPMYTIESPDLVQAESTLIGAAATYDLTTAELTRARELFLANQAVAQRELEQATNDQQTADGALAAARDGLRLFGKTDAEIERIVATRKVDPALVVTSPIAGQVTAVTASPGTFVQPGTAPAPFTVADTGRKWMLAYVAENDSPRYRVGQPVSVTLGAYPDRRFSGRISKVAPNVDPNTHKVLVRSEVTDPQDELRPGMLANFVIRLQEPVETLALPADGPVREGDGTMTVWVTTDRRHFTPRTVTVGGHDAGMVQVLSGLSRGELAVTEGGVFLSNMLDAPPSD